MIRRLYGRDPLYSLLLTFGLAFISKTARAIIWGPQTLPFSIPDWLSTPLSNRLSFSPATACSWSLLVVAVVIGLFFILNRTRLGMRIRAGTIDLETVSVLGVNVRMLRNLNFGLGIYLAGLAGVLAAGMLGLQPTIGSSLIMPSFVAIIVGGLGSLPGTLVGRSSDRRRLWRDRGVLSIGERGGDLCNDGARPAGSAARPFGRGRKGFSERDQKAGGGYACLAGAA